MSVVIALLIIVAFLYAISRSRGNKSKGSSPARSNPREVPLRVSIDLSYSYRAERLDPTEAAARGEKLWIAPGETTTIARRTIPGGMIYVGSDLPSISGLREAEPALIDPSLPVNWSDSDREGHSFSYWPSYSEIPPGARAAYLSWLEGGRCDPTIGTGYVFLFFYGLERRLFADAAHSKKARREVPAITAEVERLLSIYGSNRSFRRYSTAFLSAVKSAFPNPPLCDSPPPVVDAADEMPLQIRVALGQLSVAGRPVSAEWALAWYFGHPEVRPRTPVRRCPEEFRTLFVHRYAQRLGDGLVVKPNKARLRGAYVPASASFGGEVPVELGDLPDVMALTKPFRAIEEVAEECTTALEPYSRLVGRAPSSRGSLEAIGLLPSELAVAGAGSEADSLRCWLEARLTAGTALVDGAELHARWPTSRKDRFLRSEAVALSQLFQKLGYALEPDVRFGGPAITAATKAVLFRFPAGHPEAPSRAYISATALLGLAAVVASADGEVSEAEERHLEKHLETALHLEPGESARLSAHLRWLLAVQPGLSGTRKRLGDIDAPTRSAIARFATLVAGADGRVDPSEVKTLQRIYRTLGVDEERVFSDIHSLGQTVGAPEPGPVTVRPAQPVEEGFAVPPWLGQRKGIALDMQRVEAKLVETAAVSSLLAGIFVEEEEESAPVPATPLAGAPAVSGLDERHGGLAHALGNLEALSREEFEQLGQRFGLLPDGALDVLNEAALEKCGEPLLDGDDPIEVNRRVLEEMLR